MGTLIFLECGCAGLRGLTHPTGAAALVQIVRPCDDHAGFDALLDGVSVRSVPKDQLVSQFARTPLDGGSVTHRLPRPS